MSVERSSGGSCVTGGVTDTYGITHYTNSKQVDTPPLSSPSFPPLSHFIMSGIDINVTANDEGVHLTRANVALLSLLCILAMAILVFIVLMYVKPRRTGGAGGRRLAGGLNTPSYL